MRNEKLRSALSAVTNVECFGHPHSMSRPQSGACISLLGAESLVPGQIDYLICPMLIQKSLQNLLSDFQMWMLRRSLTVALSNQIFLCNLSFSRLVNDASDHVEYAMIFRISFVNWWVQVVQLLMDSSSHALEQLIARSGHGDVVRSCIYHYLWWPFSYLGRDL